MSVDDSFHMTISLDKLFEYSDPTLDNPWGCGRITKDDILLYDDSQNVYDYIPDFDEELFSSFSYNVGRIAYFFNYGWEKDISKDTEPITIDVGFEDYTPNYIIMDGNHRIAAAKFLGYSTIDVSIIGDIDKAFELFQS